MSAGNASQPSGKTPNAAPAGNADGPLRGIALILAASLFFSCADTGQKWLTATMSPFEAVWLRYSVFTVLAVSLAGARVGRVFRTRQLPLQIARGLSMVAAACCFTWALHYLPVAEATAINFVFPLFITGLSIVFLKERITLGQLLATLVGLAGVLMIVQPGSAAFQPAALLPVLTAGIWSCGVVITRYMSAGERPETTLAYSALVGVIILTAVQPFVWRTPTVTELLIGAATGIASTVGHWLFVLAFRNADASTLAPFTYSQIVWATGLGYLVFGNLPGASTFIGGTIIVAAGLYVAHGHRRKETNSLVPPA